MTESMKGVEMKGDKLYKEDQTSGKIDEISKKNPEMGRFIQLGQWAHMMLGRLKNSGVTSNSKIVQLKSLTDGGTTAMNSSSDNSTASTANDDMKMMSFASNFTTWLMLSVQDKNTQAVTNFEMQIEYHPKLYRKPYLAIQGGWVLDAQTKRRVSALPAFPQPR